MLVVHPLRAVLRLLPALAAVLLAGSTTGRGALWGLAGTGVAVVLGVLPRDTTSYPVARGPAPGWRGVLRRQAGRVAPRPLPAPGVSASPPHPGPGPGPGTG